MRQRREGRWIWSPMMLNRLNSGLYPFDNPPPFHLLTTHAMNEGLMKIRLVTMEIVNSDLEDEQSVENLYALG